MNNSSTTSLIPSSSTAEPKDYMAALADLQTRYGLGAAVGAGAMHSPAPPSTPEKKWYKWHSRKSSSSTTPTRSRPSPYTPLPSETDTETQYAARARVPEATLGELMTRYDHGQGSACASGYAGCKN